MGDTDNPAAFRIDGMNIVITGGTGVLGSVMSSALVERGANVAVLGRSLDKTIDLVNSLPAGPQCGKGIAVQCDVQREDSLRQAVDAVIAEFGQIDALINGAGGNRPDATTSPELPFFDLPASALRSVFDLNMIGTVLPCQAVGRHMAERKQGIILNISSMNAFRPLTRTPAYAAAKAGVSNFTQWLAVHMAQEYSPQIRVNALAPGFFLTGQNRFLLTDRETGALTPRGSQIITHTPMSRFGSPDDLIGPMVWLLSPASAFVTGIVVPVDGGFSAFSGV